MDSDSWNAKFFNEYGKPIPYEHDGVADSLKIVYRATRGRHAIKFSPACLYVWLNGQPLTMVNGLTFSFNYQTKNPTATIVFTLADVDIDADTLLALEAIVRGKEEGHGEESSTTD